MAASAMFKKKYNDKNKERGPSAQVLFQNLIQTYYNASPYVKNVRMNHELEVKFGTKGIKPLTKIDYDNVIRTLKSFGFTSANEQGYYMLRATPEYLDKFGQFSESNIRTEINGFRAIQEYCKTNSILKVKGMYEHSQSIQLVKKSRVKVGEEKLQDVNFNDFNFRVSYKTEETVSFTGGLGHDMTENWEKMKKTFRYINRVTFTHPDYPINVDISIVKSSHKSGYKLKPEYTTQESGVFSNPEVYELEMEINNNAIGPGTAFNDPETILQSLRKCIKYVLMGLQSTNYPVSYYEQKDVIRGYMHLLHGDKHDPEKKIYPTDFLGPSSLPLQMINICPINENMNAPNIRKDYVVTDKADGDRHLLYINSTGKIYLINTNMSVIFTGAITNEKTAFDSLMDGELILHNKGGQFINLFAAFDVYYVGKEDVRGFGFLAVDTGKTPGKGRYMIMKTLLKVLKPTSIVNGEISPVRIESKRFYPEAIVPGSSDLAIFGACKHILTKVGNGLFEYNTDGLIFTPAFMGVGGNAVGKMGKLGKMTWEYSFKWKPAEYNTIDFLVTTKKQANGDEIVTPIFEDGVSATDLSQYKTIVLRCGFSEKDHGYINPCQDLLDDKVPDFGERDNERNYKPVQFYPTSPYDARAGLCKIMLKKDDTGVMQMFSEEGEVFEDNTIVEFKYDFSREGEWRWVPLRVRHDKTTELRQGFSRNYGNAYHVADSNWKSIHNPILVEMITNGSNVPEYLEDSDVYYNKQVSSSKTIGLREFHNYIKSILITNVSKRGDILIDYACGKGGDFPKWIHAKLAFVFGIDISKDNLENKLNGACVRYLNFHKTNKHVPYALFVHGNSSLNIRNGAAMLSDKAIQITKAVFGEGGKDEAKLGKAVARQYGVGQEGFNISSCQFALHYFFESVTTLQNFARNLAECTKLGGYFVGTAYDGKLVFNMLKTKPFDDGINIIDDSVKIWEIKKKYVQENFEDDSSCLGYTIDVFQETINKLIPEFLVNYDYFNRVMENFGFQIITREEAQTLGLPEGSGLFSDLYSTLTTESQKNKYKAKEYGHALNMNSFEKKISFLNRYVIYKKIRIVNAAKVVLDEEEDDGSVKKVPKKASIKKRVTVPKEKVRKLTSKLVLMEEEQEEEPEPEPEKPKEQEQEPEPKEEEQEKPKSKPKKAKKIQPLEQEPAPEPEEKPKVKKARKPKTQKEVPAAEPQSEEPIKKSAPAAKTKKVRSKKLLIIEE